MKAKFPNLAASEVAKEMGKRWEACEDRAKYEKLALKDKERYAKVIKF